MALPYAYSVVVELFGADSAHIAKWIERQAENEQTHE